MRYQASYTVSFNADSDAHARTIANAHHQQLHDQLQVEGADHPYDITLDRIVTEGRAAIDRNEDRPIAQ